MFLFCHPWPMSVCVCRLAPSRYELLLYQFIVLALTPMFPHRNRTYRTLKPHIISHCILHLSRMCLLLSLYTLLKQKFLEFNQVPINGTTALVVLGQIVQSSSLISLKLFANIFATLGFDHQATQ